MYDITDGLADSRRRRNIKVREDRDENGNIMPVTIYFDGKQYTVDRVLDIQNKAATKAGGFGLRYTVCLTNEEENILSKKAYIYLEVGADPEVWFVEAKT